MASLVLELAGGGEFKMTPLGTNVTENTSGFKG